MNILKQLQASDPAVEPWEILFFGRLIGETIAHELYHALLPAAFNHNVDPVTGNDAKTADIMDNGAFRSFFERTGIIVTSIAPADFIANLKDTGIGSINKLTGVNLNFVRTHFTLPPVPPFDK